MRMPRSNPVFTSARSYTEVSDRQVTYANVAFKTIFLVAVGVLSAFFTLTNLSYFNLGFLFGALILAFISVIIGTRSVKLSPIFSVIYAICEGAFLGIVSLAFATLYQGIVQVALVTTLVVLVVMMLLFSTGVIKITQKFASILVVGLISVIIMSVIYIIFPFGTQFYTLIVIVSSLLSAFFLLLDFQNIKSCVESGTDAKVGWILALGLMVTIVWIYIEMLQLLAIISRR